ncbi:CpaE family protein [Aeromicrobium sp. CTD01-1L150]|uniref:AAA family ATPase n=1 Tax=Aeromicrobium sp. CTD01-1L150 TaxID=3341830 RepID=UPI0035C200A1
MRLVLVVGGDEELARRLQGFIGHQTISMGAEAVQDDPSAFLRGLDPAVFPDAMIITSAVPLETAMALGREVSTLRPDVDIVLVAATEKEIMLEAMRAGFRDVAAGVDDPALLAGLRDRLAQRDASARQAPAERGPGQQASGASVDFTSRGLVVLSPKGGVGKTSIATNLSVALARQSPMEVVLVDLDLQFGDVATVLDLAPAHTLDEAFESGSQDNLLLKTYLTVHPAGFFVLCGADSPAANERVTSAQVASLVRQLKQQFRYVVVDTAGGLDEATLGALEEADDVVMVSTMDIACLRGVRKALELVGELGLLPASRHVVLNFADKHSGLRVKDVESMLGVPVDFVLPRAKEVPVGANKGVPIMVSNKSGQFVKTVRALAQRVDDRARAADGKQGHKRLEVA